MLDKADEVRLPHLRIWQAHQLSNTMPLEFQVDKGEEKVCRVDGGTNTVSVIVGIVAECVGQVSRVTIEEPIYHQA